MFDPSEVVCDLATLAFRVFFSSRGRQSLGELFLLAFEIVELTFLLLVESHRTNSVKPTSAGLLNFEQTEPAQPASMPSKLSAMTRIDEFISQIKSAAESGNLLGLTLAKPIGDAVRTTVRPLEVAGKPVFQWEWQQGPQTLHENIPAGDVASRIADVAGARFLHIHAFTSEHDLSLLISKKGKATLQRKRPSKSPTNSKGHDRQRSYIIPEGVPCPFLEAAGVMLPDGRVPKAKWSKFRQINRFLELVNDIYEELPADGPLSVIEFGSGKSHLTFALHHLLAKHHGREVTMRAIDRNASVAESAQQTSERLGLTGISHETANIADIELREPVHLAVWLHACDTATDDALAISIRSNANVILAVPCCQHEILHSMQSDSLLAQYGILKERYAAMTTDALRAAALEILGYRTQVVEFIDLEHTAKNVLIRAVRRDQAIEISDWRERYATMRREAGLSTWRLEKLLPELVAKPEGE